MTEYIPSSKIQTVVRDYCIQRFKGKGFEKMNEFQNQ